MNCKPGDLAYIVGGCTNPSPNIGRIVEVVRFDGTFPNLGATWLCKSREPLKTLNGMKNEFHTADAWLRPISGVPVHDEQRDEVPA